MKKGVKVNDALFGSQGGQGIEQTYYYQYQTMLGSCPLAQHDLIVVHSSFRFIVCMVTISILHFRRGFEDNSLILLFILS